MEHAYCRFVFEKLIAPALRLARTPGALQTRLAGPKNAFLTKLDPSGNIVFSTFLGGSVMDQGRALQVDAAGSAYVAGSATSLDFPTTQGSFQPAPLVPAWAGSPLGFLANIAPDTYGAMHVTSTLIFGVLIPRASVSHQ
jgi:hypothetical protein